MVSKMSCESNVTGPAPTPVDSVVDPVAKHSFVRPSPAALRNSKSISK